MSVDITKSKVVYRKFHGSMDIVTMGEGPYLYFDDGVQRFDLSSGPCTSSLGHSNLQVISAIKDQLGKIPFAFSGFWASEQSEKLGDLIHREFERTWPGWFGKVLFLSAGGEAVDLACKLAYQYWIEGFEKKILIGAREFGFHGVGLLTAALSGNYPRYELIDHYHQPTRNNYVVRLPGYLGIPDVGLQKQISMIEYESLLLVMTEKIVGFNSLAAVIVETVGGPPVGIATPLSVYMKGLRDICDRHNTLLIFDEILCGVGRCGEFTAAQLYGVKPDILILGKGLTSGYLPLSALCISERIVDRLSKGSGLVSFGTTYSAHTTACAAGVATLEYLRDNYLYDMIFRRGEHLKLREYFSDLPVVFAVRGLGYLWGIEFWDPIKQCSFSPEVEFHLLVRKEAYKRGLVTYSKGQTVNGLRDYLIVAPPFDADLGVLDEPLSKLRWAISSAYEQFRKGSI